MITENDSITTEAHAPKPRQRVRFANAVEMFGRAAGVQIDASIRERLFQMNDDEFSGLLTRLTENFVAALRGVELTRRVAAYDVQIQNFALWQKLDKCGGVFTWSDSEMATLLAKLNELGPGCELIFCFAMSVGCKLPNGRLILLDRKGNETKG